MKYSQASLLLAFISLIIGTAIVIFPVYVAFVGSTHDSALIGRGQMPMMPGPSIFTNYSQAWRIGSSLVGTPPLQVMMRNSLLVALGISIGKITLSLLTAYAVVFFNLPMRNFFFWLIFLTLMLPLEARIIPTYKVMSDLKLLDTYAGLIIPHTVSATGTLLFRQVLRAFPRELLDAARVDGAGPLRCLWAIVIPSTKPQIAALFTILFLAGWNQYLWPLLMTTKPSMYTVTIGIVKMAASGEALVDWGVVMAGTCIAMIIPLVIVLALQRWLVMGMGAMAPK